MKSKILVLILFFMMTLIACNEDGTPLNDFLNTNNLASQFFEINIHTDTIFHTANGATITIPKDAITSASPKVRLEVKEAYRIEDILKAGLQTKSGDKLLSSGGMIYLNVKEADAAIKIPIQISMPSSNVETGMKLFKGKKDENGNIDWQEPQSLLPNKTFDTIAQGKAIFMNNCRSCHHLSKEATGPPLLFTSQRLDHQWMGKWIRNSAKLIASGDPYANCIYNRYSKTAMTAFPGLTDDDLKKTI